MPSQRGHFHSSLIFSALYNASFLLHQLYIFLLAVRSEHHHLKQLKLLKWMFFLWERMKIVVEPTGALAVAALLHGKVNAAGKRVGAIISGGNVDPAAAGAWFAA